MVAINTFKDSVESVLRSVDNMKRMIEMTQRAMVLAHGGRIIERVEIRKEAERDEEEDWGDVTQQTAFSTRGLGCRAERNPMLCPAYLQECQVFKVG